MTRLLTKGGKVIHPDTCPFPELEGNAGFPDIIFVLKKPQDEGFRYLIADYRPAKNLALPGITAMACFTTRRRAIQVAIECDDSYLITELSFDDAVDIAQQFTDPLVDALVLLEDENQQPIFHFLR